MIPSGANIIEGQKCQPKNGNYYRVLKEEIEVKGMDRTKAKDPLQCKESRPKKEVLRNQTKGRMSSLVSKLYPLCLVFLLYCLGLSQDMGSIPSSIPPRDADELAALILSTQS